DESYYEAAAIDGANWLQLRTKITIPMIIPMIITMFIMNIGRIFYADFGLFYMVPKDTGTLYPATDVIDTYVYRALVTDADVGKSAAAGLYQSFVGFALVMFTNALAKKYDKNTAIF
ncbi:MAG: ABC transporter permease subunit, partial [Clostridia bacterium]|nr:ABC transporter permease subunit [Clostridia bacterium]